LSAYDQRANDTARPQSKVESILVWILAIYPAKYLALLFGIEFARPPRTLARLQLAQTRAFPFCTIKPLVNRGPIHSIARDNVNRTFAFAHTLNGHQPYRLLRFSMKLSAIYFHAIYDYGDIPKDPKVSTYLLTYE